MARTAIYGLNFCFFDFSFSHITIRNGVFFLCFLNSLSSTLNGTQNIQSILWKAKCEKCLAKCNEQINKIPHQTRNKKNNNNKCKRKEQALSQNRNEFYKWIAEGKSQRRKLVELFSVLLFLLLVFISAERGFFYLNLTSNKNANKKSVNERLLFIIFSFIQHNWNDFLVWITQFTPVDSCCWEATQKPHLVFLGCYYEEEKKNIAWECF